MARHSPWERAGVTEAWERTAAQAGATADSLHACPIPHGSQGRVNLAQHKLMSKVFASPPPHGSHRPKEGGSYPKGHTEAR